MKPSDFRTDTVTRPTPAMLAAMARAEVGDDGRGEDPTVRRLEETAANLLGKEAALFLPSGTMANQAAFAVWTRPGEEVLAEEDSHCLRYEGAGIARISGAQTRTLRERRGALDPREVERSIRPGGIGEPRTALVVVEQTHLGAGGAVVPIETLREIREAAVRRGVRVHMDGARLFNASVASGVPAIEYAATADSVAISLSKGLCGPAGSILLGERSFVEKARGVRKWLGGAMRQVGYLAACGLVALAEMVERLAEDHALARILAEGLASVPGLEVGKVETNVVLARLLPPLEAKAFCAWLASRGVLAGPFGEGVVRFTTHRDVGPSDVERALAAARDAVRAPVA